MSSPTKADIVNTLNTFYGRTAYSDFNTVPLDQLLIAIFIYNQGAVSSGTTQSINGTVSVNNFSDLHFPDTQLISAASLPLPAGAATDVVLQAIRDRLPLTLGSKTAANSLAVTLATDGVFAQYFGNPTDAVGTSDTGNFSFLASFKNLLTKISTIVTNITGSVSSPATNVITVQGAAGGVAMPISGSLKLADGTTPTQTLAIAADGSIRLGGSQRTPGVIAPTNAGTIAAGAIEIGIANIGNAPATVQGVSYPANTSIGWTARQGDTLGAVTYDATGTQLLITTQR